jgi:cytochrome c peroxidase
MPVALFVLLALAGLGVLSGCREREAHGVPRPAEPASAVTSAAGSSRPPSPRAHAPEPSALARAGKRLFFDPSLSASGKMSCATCHDPNHAYGPPDDRAVELGGPNGDQVGSRAVPSLRYKEYTPAYADLLDNPDGMSAPGPGGGFTWDGRANTLADQAALPLLSAVEMANKSADDVVQKLRATSYAGELEQAFGRDAWGDTQATFRKALAALEAFQREDASFHPYTSKFDLHAGNKLGGDFTPAEQRGFLVFADTKRGNCASCHFTGAGLGGSSGLFTDFSYEAIGVPRNRALPQNQNPNFFDLGVCGPLRGDHAPERGAANTFCGMFKTPTLRNVATRKAFFHNGVMHSLEDAIRFYNTRDTQPELWYPKRAGKIVKFDDLPPVYRKNIDPQLPLDGRRAGSKEPLSAQNVRDLVCFIQTLNDDYVPPATPPKTGACVD